ncbi:MAG: hypothetical protein AUK55_13575 [Syntrophobacteraceae bacterium CG2_30_61_12]|nr:MAG: hypothetical protein AUK55_13575 [Syntrophobacteraceae bacterium CG2_30_61_12]PIU32508.1 MAG: hypothetical protein COT06_02360 [Syntrophobacteraceae bacterium CG07_land_8_20_14_0_80_61_8]
MIHSDFSTVCKYFEARYGAMAGSGAVPYRQTERGAWAFSRLREVHYFFRTLKLERYRSLIDLGSGDGIVVCVAALFTRAIGIEINGELCRLAARAARDLGLERRARFIRSDYTTQRIQAADCLYLYPDKPIHAMEALLESWSGDLLVYGPHFPAARMKAVRRLESGPERLVIYRN